MQTRKDYEQTVKSPGKFEGEQVYVPYLWEEGICSGQGFGVISDFGLYCDSVTIQLDDLLIFPELKAIETIYLCENSQGFVSEMTKEEYDNTEKAYDKFCEATEEE